MRISCVQWDVAFGQAEVNARRACDEIRRQAGTDLIVFPEAFLTGYAVRTQESALELAIERTHPSLKSIQQAADETGTCVVIGFAERDGDALANTAAIVTPGQPMRFYRKTHLPELGFDKFVIPGSELPVFDMPWGRLGVAICFDLRHPEACRVLALKGADVIAVPTNWPDGAQIAANFNSVTRAAENKVYLAAANRVGTENGFTFIGLSKVIAPSGKVLASADAGEQVIQVEADLSLARDKRSRVVPGEYEFTVFESRRPELYAEIALGAGN